MPDDLQQAVKAYVKESEGYTRSKVCFLDNWFKMRRRNSVPCELGD